MDTVRDPVDLTDALDEAELVVLDPVEAALLVSELEAEVAVLAADEETLVTVESIVN